MKRRSLLLGSAGVALAAGGAALLWRPDDLGAPHTPYFADLNSLLRRDGPGHPVMLLDRERLNSNIDKIRASVGPDKTYRIVVKSLPSIPLLAHVMQRANTNALMVFHQPLLKPSPRPMCCSANPCRLRLLRRFITSSQALSLLPRGNCNG